LDVTDQPNGIASISKYSSAGVLQWRRRYNNFNVSPGAQNNTLFSAGRVAVVSNGDFIHAFAHRQGNISYLYVARFDTNGGFIWGRKLTTSVAPLGIVLDEPADRLYIYTYSVAQIFEYSLSGVFQKAVQITYTDGTQAFTGFVNVGVFGLRAPNNGLCLGVGGSEFIRIQHVGRSYVSRVYNPLPAAVNVTRDQYNASSGTWSYFEPTQSNTFTYTLSALAIGDQASETLSPVDVTTTIDEAISLNTAVNYSESIATSTYNITRTLS
jgi:hypothetical protein